jgi:spoIIIJ-associated protein
MNVLEFEGKSIDEAISKACEEFGVSREKLSVDIISEGAMGFFGIGNKKAKIKASLLSFDESPGDTSVNIKPVMSCPVEERSNVVSLSEDRDISNNAKYAKEFLEGILSRMNLDCAVSVIETSESITLNIEGDGEGILIGRRGQNLDALQYILNKSTQKSSNGRKRIIVDTESYRKRREESLRDLAIKIGMRVKKTNKAVTLSYLNAHNRRIIHMALQNDSSVITKSRGEGEYRKIVIVPVKKD